MDHNYRIQIVEDQYFVAMDCQQALEEAGLECSGLAASAERAIELAARDHPDLILMDIRLSGEMDGVDAALRIYRDYGIRCIFSSAHTDAATRSRAEEAHPLGWLQKPYTADHVVEAVKDALDRLDHERSSMRAVAVNERGPFNRDWS
jgi:two-component system, response regulator PdtaR